MDRMLTKEGEKLFAEGKLDPARERFLQAIKDDPEDKEALNNLGVIACEQDQLGLAARYFTKCISVDPYYLDGVFNFCDLLKTTDNLGGAANLLEMVAERYPDNTEISLLLDESRSQTVEVESRGGASSRTQSESCPTTPVVNPVVNDPLNGKKVLHAPFEIAGCMERFARHLRLANVNATSANYYDSWLNYRCDVNLRVNSMSESERSEAINQFAIQAIKEFDIFHFHFAHSLYPDLRDLKELRARDKKILFSFWGNDARSPEWTMYQQARFLGYRPPRPYALSRQHYQIHKTIERYADVLIGLESLPRGIWVPGHADTSQWNLEAKQACLDKKLVTRDPGKTYFVHAPTNQFKKGSAILLRLLQECKDEGMPIEVICINQVEPSKAREIYACADFAIDQVGPGTYGLFGIEMMCWKIPVLVNQIELFEQLRGKAPVISITKANFKEQIERCVEMKNSGEIEELGATSRKWAIEKEDISIAIPEFLRIYRDLLDGKQIPQNINRAWYDEEARMQNGVKSEFYRYMIEQDVFSEMGMAVPEYDSQLYV